MPSSRSASSQWFANLDPVKSSAIDALSRVNFFPSRGARTLEMYVHGRSEWCISRQRAWGVPIPVVYSSAPGAAAKEVPLLTPANVDHIVRVLEAHGGTDHWWAGDAAEFVLPEERERAAAEGRTEWRTGTDTMDVWFDSGCSWTLLREEGVRDERGADEPLADVYFEGSDQHRGWFQSSLLTKVSSAREGEVPQAPYRDVVTHGMVLDDKGRKMSKSLGNIVSPSVVIQGGKVRPLSVRSLSAAAEAAAADAACPARRTRSASRRTARTSSESGSPRSTRRATSSSARASSPRRSRVCARSATRRGSCSATWATSRGRSLPPRTWAWCVSLSLFPCPSCSPAGSSS